ncbi:hypothetical protein LOR37_12215 [Clostridium estertheticum]|uniref:hypothetical protein n=2 Tax=Clostridium estertheticum TaxID=238834 RepID=UPI0022DD788F|nr:hypothetical protein [Clostridium estertheticum]WBL45462.1 hypothetical protein LOR37_12215 [Clostridium estertheticum]
MYAWYSKEYTIYFVIKGGVVILHKKGTKQWIIIFVFYTIIVFLSLLTTRVMLASELLVRPILGLLIVSVVSGLIPCIGGFLGKWIFFIIYTLCTIVAIIYMFYIVMVNTSPGWGDLTSIIGYLFIIIVGTVLALVTEVLSYFIKTKLIKNKKV